MALQSAFRALCGHHWTWTGVPHYIITEALSQGLTVLKRSLKTMKGIVHQYGINYVTPNLKGYQQAKQARVNEIVILALYSHHPRP